MEQEVLKVRFKKLVENAVIPTYKTVGAAGMDLTATSTEFIDFGNQLKAYTGIAVEIPKGYVGLLFPRSSIVKTNNRLANCVGVIDSDYRGEITFIFDNIDVLTDRLSNYTDSYEARHAVGQLVILPFPKVEMEEVDELSETKRGTGGYGHTGR